MDSGLSVRTATRVEAGRWRQIAKEVAAVSDGSRRTTVALAGAAVLVLAGCASTGKVTTSQSPLPTQAAPPAITRVTIVAPSCENCLITAYRALEGQQVQTDYQLGSAEVLQGQAAFDVPTASTYGMSFGIRNIGQGYKAKQGQPFLVLGYGGRPPGTRLGASASALQRTGSWCWAGTKQAEFTIHLNSQRFNKPGNKPAKVISFWASPTLNVPVAAPNLKFTYRGGIGIVGVPFCTITH